MVFVQAKNYTKGRLKKVRLLVIHSAETPEGVGTAMSVARYFSGPQAPQASAHYVVDAKEVVQCVADGDTAWHTPGVNSESLGIEHAGIAAQTRTQWTDDYSRQVLARSAKLTAALAKKFGIPLVHLTNADLKAGKAGFIGHAQATAVYGGTHTDPGPNFPWDVYMAMVQAEYDALTGKKRTTSIIASLAVALGVAVSVFSGVSQAQTPSAPIRPSHSSTAPVSSPTPTTSKTSTTRPTAQPTTAVFYVVKPGETLGGIAVKYHTTVAAILRLNPTIKNPALIVAGRKIRVR